MPGKKNASLKNPDMYEELREDGESFLVGWKDIEVVSREAVVLREGFEGRSPAFDQT